jgi:O-antigen/teichoic acid export membrane protein
MTAALGGRIVLQAVMFLIVARALGVDEFGQFAAALALAAIVAPFAALGMGNVLVMRVARDPRRLGRHWRASLVTLAVLAPVLGALVVAAGSLLLPGVPAVVFLGVCASELLFARVVELSAQAFQACERMASMAALTFGAALARTSAAVVMVASVSSPTATVWAGWYTAAAFVSAASSVFAVRHVLRPEPARARPATADLREGVYFALGLSASGIVTDADKALVARIDSFAAAGAYTAGYRVVSFSFVPILALLSTTYAGFFRAGARGLRSSWDYARTLLPKATGYSVAAGAGLFLIAPLIPSVLGSDYEPAVETIRLLSVLPTLQTWSYLAGEALMGAGHQRLRALLLWAGATVSVIGALALIPPLGANGAALATLLASGFLVATSWLAVARLQRVSA